MSNTQTNNQKGSILVIDDEPASLKMLLTILSERGYAVYPANEGQLGLQFVKHTLPDLILVDIRMPGMDGYQVCEALKNDPSTCAIPVIFISSTDQVPDKLRAFRGGAVDYVTKPLDSEEVLARIETHISLRRLREDLESVVRVDERLRLARELHDTLLQSFHGLLMRFHAVQYLLPGRVAEAQQVLEVALDRAAQAITEARDAVQGLRSSAVTENDLAKAIEAMGQELATHHKETDGGAPVFSLEVEGASRDLHPILRDEIYRITGEAVRNAFHHALAGRIKVEIRYDARQLRVRVRDDGIGIDAELLGENDRAGHFGLRGMRERAKGIGGQLEVRSQRGAGTEIELMILGSVAYGRAPTRARVAAIPQERGID